MFPPGAAAAAAAATGSFYLPTIAQAQRFYPPTQMPHQVTTLFGGSMQFIVLVMISVFGFT
jgi:hypothetical protein